MATLVVATGRANTTSALASSNSKFVAWGTGAGTTADGDTTLFTESAEARTTGTQSQVTTTTTNDTYQVTGTITATAGRTITNAGIFDASSGGNLFFKGDFSGVVLASGDSIAFTMKSKLA